MVHLQQYVALGVSVLLEDLSREVLLLRISEDTGHKIFIMLLLKILEPTLFHAYTCCRWMILTNEALPSAILTIEYT